MEVRSRRANKLAISIHPSNEHSPNKLPNALSVIFHGGAFCAASPTHGIRSAALGGTLHYPRPTCVIRAILVGSISVVIYVGFEILPRRFFQTPPKFMRALSLRKRKDIGKKLHAVAVFESLCVYFSNESLCVHFSHENHANCAHKLWAVFSTSTMVFFSRRPAFRSSSGKFIQRGPPSSERFCKCPLGGRPRSIRAWHWGCH